jgi:hypothetical protein
VFKDQREWSEGQACSAFPPEKTRVPSLPSQIAGAADLPTLDRKLELLALHHLGIINPEEIRVQNRLQHARNHRNRINLVMRLRHIPIDPVRNVQGAIDSQGEEVMRRDGLGLSRALQHEELGQNGNALKPDGEGPAKLENGVAHGEEDGEHAGKEEEELDAEGIEVGVVGGLVPGRHQVDDVALRRDEEDFEDEVVRRRRPREVCGR